MLPERSQNRDGWNRAPADERPPPEEMIRATRVEDDELLLWSAASDGAWLQSDEVRLLPDQADPVER